MKGSIPIDRSAVTVALLAAGRATRFGGGKLDAPCAGKPLACWAVDAVAEAGLPPGICVTGPNEPQFLDGAQGWDWVINPDPEEGIGSSLATVARLALYRGSEAILVLLADMPLIDARHLQRLVACTGPAATDHGDFRPGVPALFPAVLLPKLSRLTGDEGAAATLRSLPDLVLLSPSPYSLLDVDTAEDLVRAEELLLRRG